AREETGPPGPVPPPRRARAGRPPPPWPSPPPPPPAPGHHSIPHRVPAARRVQRSKACTTRGNRCRAWRALPGRAAAGGPADTRSQTSDGVSRVLNEGRHALARGDDRGRGAHAGLLPRRHGAARPASGGPLPRGLARGGTRRRDGLSGEAHRGADRPALGAAVGTRRHLARPRLPPP